MGFSRSWRTNALSLLRSLKEQRTPEHSGSVEGKQRNRAKNVVHQSNSKAAGKISNPFNEPRDRRGIVLGDPPNRS